MKRLVAFAFVSVFVIVSGLPAQWHDGEKQIPDEPWRKSIGEFGTMLLITNDPDSFFEQWSKPSSPDYKPEVKTSSEAKRGDTVVALIVFMGCGRDESGNCNTEVEYRVFRPDGSKYGEHQGGELWKREAPPARHLQVSMATLAFKIESDDPIGRYKIEARVRDKVTNMEISLQQYLDIKDSDGG